MYLSPYVEKIFNSNVVKSFVPDLRSRKCFCVSGFLCYLYMSNEHSMYVSCMAMSRTHCLQTLTRYYWYIYIYIYIYIQTDRCQWSRTLPYTSHCQPVIIKKTQLIKYGWINDCFSLFFNHSMIKLDLVEFYVIEKQSHLLFSFRFRWTQKFFIVIDSPVSTIKKIVYNRWSRQSSIKIGRKRYRYRVSQGSSVEHDTLNLVSWDRAHPHTQKPLINWNEKENNCMNISSAKVSL